MSNDRFKFRVWAEKLKRYYYEMRLTVDGDLVPSKWLEPNSIPDLGRIVIEQCTGLKDKNGKLIFEGDVVRYYRSTAMCLGGERIAQVLWDARDAEFGILTTLGDGYNMWEALRFNIEVIGNIHEMESKND